MKVKCDYCDNYIDETDEQCPYCGAPNAHMTRSGRGVPKTIDELLAFCEARGIPLDKMRFFIGQDYRGAKAFGIYQDDEGNFVVYKNKANGERAIRYRGDDEAYAVNEIYQKMRAEVLERKQAAGTQGSSGSDGGLSGTKLFARVARLVVATIAGMFVVVALNVGFHYVLYKIEHPQARGYYHYNNTYYYYDNGWLLDSDDGWISTSYVPSELDENYRDYYEGNDWSSLGDDSVTQYVSTTSDNDWLSSDWDDDDWSSSDDWDWDSYDSSDTDWDSDW